MEIGFVHQKSHTISMRTHESDSHCYGSDLCMRYTTMVSRTSLRFSHIGVVTLMDILINMCRGIGFALLRRRHVGALCSVRLHGDSPQLRPRSSPRSTRKPASPDAEGDGKFSLRAPIGLSPEAAREIRPCRNRRNSFERIFRVPRSGFRCVPWSRLRLSSFQSWMAIAV